MLFTRSQSSTLKRPIPVITLENTSEITTARRVMAERIPADHPLTLRLAHLVSISAVEDEVSLTDRTFQGNECVTILEGLHDTAQRYEADGVLWDPAQARHMLYSAREHYLSQLALAEAQIESVEMSGSMLQPAF